LAVDNFPTNFKIWPQPILLYIFNGMAINNLQNVLFSKNGLPISDPYFLNQAWASQRLAFFENPFVCDMSMCVCSSPKLLITSGMIGYDMKPLWLAKQVLYFPFFYIVVEVVVNPYSWFGCGLCKQSMSRKLHIKGKVRV